MSRLLSYALVTMLLTAPVAAHSISVPDDDDKNSSKTESEKTEKKAAPPMTLEFDNDQTLADIDLSLRSPTTETNDGFIYLKDRSPISAITGTGENKRPTFSSLLAPNGTLRNVQAGVLDTSSRIGLAFGADEDSRGLEIAIESAFQLSGAGIPTSTERYTLEQQFADRVYNVGVSVGYSGFNLDATVIREENLLTGNTEGFGVGFSYTGNRWAARLSLNEYTEGSDLYGINNDVRNFVSLELGATYRLSERWGIRGGVRYSDLRNSGLLTKDFLTANQTIFLGGRFKF